MYANSRRVTSTQRDVHPHLERRVLRHLTKPFLRPVALHNAAAFASAAAAWRRHGGRLILDSGCGSGASTRRLAERHPEALVIGVDKSAHRLRAGLAAAGGREAGNCLLLRADLVDFWRLAVHAGWRLERHYLLYPNPWPKPGHLGRRWCAHPVFPVLLALGGRLEVRSNWETYILEFARAAELAAGQPAHLGQVPRRSAISPFERKYRASRQTLYRCIIDLRVGAEPGIHPRRIGAGCAGYPNANTAAATPSAARPSSAATGATLRLSPAKTTV